MFVILKVVQSEKKNIRKGKTVNDVRLVNTGAGCCFYEVEVVSGEKGVNWDEVSAIVGSHGKNVLLSDSVELPECCSVKRFDSAEFRNILLFNTMELVFRELFFTGDRVKCVINDPDGKYAQYIEKIVRYSSRTTVVTENEYRYFPCVREMYSVYGAGITVTDSVGNLDDKTICIDTTGKISDKECMIFSPDAGFCPVTVDGFSELKAYCPSYIKQVDFLGAVMQMNNRPDLKNAVCRTFEKDKKTFTVYETARMISAQNSERILNNKSIIFYV